MAKAKLPPLMKASELGNVQYVTTGFAELDGILKPSGPKTPGGFPIGRVTEIYGMEGVGKTSLTLQAVAGMQKAKKKVFFVDAENALNIERAKQFGIDLDNLTVVTESILETIADLIKAYVDQFDVIIVDSLAALVPSAEYEGDAGEAHMGLKARQMGQFMRKIIKPLADSKCALIFINQERESLEPYGPKRYTPGGKAVLFAASLRIELKSLKKDKVEKTVNGLKQVSGQRITATVVKTKVSQPYASAQFTLQYS